jgi:hypothetical protein
MDAGRSHPRLFAGPGFFNKGEKSSAKQREKKEIEGN